MVSVRPMIYILPSALKADVNVNHMLSDGDFVSFANVANGKAANTHTPL